MLKTGQLSFCAEKYETPTRVVKVDLSSYTFSSPNDPDGQTDIFWDQNSPMTKQLGNLIQLLYESWVVMVLALTPSTREAETGESL